MSRVTHSPDGSWLGRRLQVEVGPIAHGGHCVARHDGRVIFVRHAIPGESVLAEVTEDRGGAFCRADAVQVLSASADRVPPPCRYAVPGGCGGCDFQHIAIDRQRALKAQVVSEQLSRLAGLDWPVTVHALVPQDLGWRRRIRYAVAPDGRLGLHKHRSDDVIEVDRCLIGAPGVGDADALDHRWSGLAEVEIAADDTGAVAVTGFRAAPAGRRGRGRPQLRSHRESGPDWLHYQVADRQFRVQPAGFWQTHPQAAEVFTTRVLRAAGLESGERVLDLYAGAGLFTAAVAAEVGSGGHVVGIEGDRHAVLAATGNLHGLGWARIEQEPITAAVVSRAAERLQPDVVVLDPPRTGAGAQVLTAVLDARPRTVIYVACDPAALARDLRTATDQGWRLSELDAYDAYPMTHHVECIAVLRHGG